jgi:tRNA nucleotidyltransferase/poly(A) polymerase
MALDLAALRRRRAGVVIDPFGGVADLRAGRIRVIRPGAFVADPLRLLRAARLAGELGFSLDPDTRAAVVTRAPLLLRAAPERRREELCRILASRYVEKAWGVLEETGIQAVLFGDAQATSGVGAIRRAQDALRWLLRVSRSLHQDLQEEIEATFRRRELCVLAALLWGMGWTGERGRQWARDLRFSRKAQERLGRLLDLPLTDLRGAKIHLYRFLRQAREVEVEAILLARMAGNAAWSRRALAFYRGPYRQALRRPLITGRDLARLGLPPGPAYREILESAREAQAAGVINSREGARLWLRRVMRKRSIG